MDAAAVFPTCDACGSVDWKRRAMRPAATRSRLRGLPPLLATFLKDAMRVCTESPSSETSSSPMPNGYCADGSSVRLIESMSTLPS
jgi:hypothetical protein